MNLNNNISGFRRTNHIGTRHRVSRRSLWNVLTSVCACLTLVSCSGDTPSASSDDNLPIVTFNIVVEKNSVEGNTRSYGDQGTIGENALYENWGNYNPKDPGYAFDCALLKDNFSVCLYNTSDNSFEGEVVNLWGTKASEDSNSTTYQFQGILQMKDQQAAEEDVKLGSYKMMVLANIPDKFTPSAGAIKTLTFTYSGKEGSFPAVPMWGVNTIDLSSMQPGKLFDVGSVSLLRAMAMVRVKMDPTNADGRDIELKSIILNRFNSSGYVAPNKWNEVVKTEDIELGNTIRECKSDVDSQLSVEANTEEKSMIHFYVPEIVNASDRASSDNVTMTVIYSINNVQQEGLIEFCRYDETGFPASGAVPWDIVRNHIYDFKITEVPSASSKLKINVAVKAWRKVNYEIDY